MKQKDVALIDALLESALSDYLDTEGAEIIEEVQADRSDPGLTITEEEQNHYYSLIHKAVRQNKKRQNIQKRMKILNRVAIIFLVILIGLGTCVFTVDAFRAQFLNLFVDHSDKHAQLEFDTSSSVSSDIPDWVSLPTYIPQGYYEVSAVYNKDNALVDYTNEVNGGFISFTQDPSESLSAHIDIESLKEYKKVTINGYDGIYILKDGYSTLTWQGNNYAFGLFTQLSEDETIKIAESVEIK